MANIKTKVFAVGFAGALAISAFAGSALAAQPENPGCFGTDRAGYIHEFFQTSDAAPGGSEWGKEAARRAGGNATDNAKYKVDPGCGQYSD